MPSLGTGVQFVSFFILSALIIGAALGVVLAPNMLYAAFLLGFTFICLSGIYLLLNADFVAAAQILIYVGAVNVLILFAIMLVNRQVPETPVPLKKIRDGIGGLVCFGLFSLLATTVVRTPWPYSSAAPVTNTTLKIGEQFFTNYLLPFEVASVLLLMALVGAIMLARREYVPDQTESGDEPLVLPERSREDLEPALKKLPVSTASEE